MIPTRSQVEHHILKRPVDIRRWHDGDLRWLGYLICVVSSTLTVLALVLILS